MIDILLTTKAGNLNVWNIPQEKQISQSWNIH